MTKGVKLLLFFGVLVAISWGVYECKYYYSYYTDLRDRPWAYSRDKNAKLLVGKWQGTFQDPDGLQKTIELEIVEPITDKERAEKASKHLRRRSGLGTRSDKRGFDGFATVTSKLGKEEYEIYGSVQKEDWHQLNTIHFRVMDENQQLRNNFGVGAADSGQWQGDELTLTFAFVYTTATGSGYSNSADPRYEKKATVTLIRQKNSQ
jgi:hypothetical protein